MKTKKQTPKIDYVTENTYHEIIKMTGWTVESKEQFKQLLAKQYTLRGLLTYKVANDWTEKGLLDDTRSDNQQWRKYSIFDLALVSIFKALRDFGVSLEKIKSIKDYLQTPIKAFSYQGKRIDLITFAVLYTKIGRQNKNLNFYVWLDGNVFLGTAEDYDSFMAQNPQLSHTHITLCLNALWKDLIEGVVIKDESILILTPNEVSVINSIRRRNVRKVTVQKNKEEIEFIEEEYQETPQIQRLIQKTLSPYMKHIDFGQINFDFHSGKIDNLVITKKQKIEL